MITITETEMTEQIDSMLQQIDELEERRETALRELREIDLALAREDYYADATV